MLKISSLSFGNPFEGIMNAFNDIGNFFTSYIPAMLLKLLYSAWASVAQVLDCIQIIFQMLVGVKQVSYQSNSLFANSGNLVMDILMHPYVYNAFLRILVISFLLLLIFTFIAVIKNEYSSESTKGSGNSKGAIIGKSLKAIFSFFFIPIVCMFGIIASSYLLQALDYATSPTSSTVISNQLFYSSAYSCNRARIDNNFYRAMMGENVGDYNISDNNLIFANSGARDAEKLADIIDKAFIEGYAFSKYKDDMEKDGNGNQHMTTGDRFANYIDSCSFPSVSDNGISSDSYFNTKNSAMVFYFYDLGQFNWIIALFSIFFLAGILVSITLGAAVRLYELAILFILSPAVLSMMPLDNGDAFKGWKKKFVGKVVMVFAPVVALNLYFILINTLMQIDVGASLTNAINSGLSFVTISSLSDALSSIAGTHAYLLQQVFSLFICIAGAVVTKDSIKWLGDLIGAEDMTSSGDKLKKQVSDFAKTNAVMAAGAGAATFMADKAKGKLIDTTTGLKNKHDNRQKHQGELATAKDVEKEQLKAAKADIEKKYQLLEEERRSLEELNSNNTQNLLESLGVDTETAEDIVNSYNGAYGDVVAHGLSEDVAGSVADMKLTDLMRNNGIDSEYKEVITDAFKLDRFNQSESGQKLQGLQEIHNKEVEKQIQKKIKKEFNAQEKVIKAESKERRKKILSGDKEAMANDEAFNKRKQTAMERKENSDQTRADKKINKAYKKQNNAINDTGVKNYIKKAVKNSAKGIAEEVDKKIKKSKSYNDPKFNPYNKHNNKF